MSKPLILVCNDDGITAPGIRALVEVVQEFGEVMVVAPDSPQSGQGHSITLADPLRLKPVKSFDGIEAFKCSGTPADCIKIAKHFVLKGRKADLCVSGINHGSNSSINIVYSGTMGAAMEAAIEGIPSIGFSFLDYAHEADMEVCKPYVREIVKDALENGLGGSQLLNVNIPALPAAEIKGIKYCRQANGKWVETYLEKEDPYGKPYYWLTGEYVYKDAGEETDIWALENGYVSVVPSKFDLTDYEALKKRMDT